MSIIFLRCEMHRKMLKKQNKNYCFKYDFRKNTFILAAFGVAYLYVTSEDLKVSFDSET